MTNELKEISQISIYLKGEAERVNEVALFEPLERRSSFDEESKPLQQRKWTYTHQLPFFQRLSLKMQTFFFKRFPSLIPGERLSIEAKFKTVVAILLAQESLREFFLGSPKRRDNFFDALDETAKSMGFEFSKPDEGSTLKMSRQMTFLKDESLIDNLTELNLQMASLKHQERNELLFRILNHIERPPIHSVLEVTKKEAVENIALTTKYAKYKVTDWSDKKVSYTFVADQATSSIRTIENMRPGAKGVMNQRKVIDTETQEVIGVYSGELTTQQHLLEQILFILNETSGEVVIFEMDGQFEEASILFTSLYSWHEIGLITQQHEAIHALDGKVLNERYRLNLHHINISFNALNKYPTPPEMGAKIQDINDEGLIHLIWNFWQRRGIESQPLGKIVQQLESSHTLPFIEHQQVILEAIDQFRELKSTLLQKLGSSSEDRALYALITEKKPDGKPLKGIDKLIYLDLITKELGYLHNKNCQNSTDRSAGANAADKASYAYRKISEAPFLPGEGSEEEISLFKVLYSMYLVWEEPEINAALSTGFYGEKFYQNFLQKNPETTRYLIHWLKKHPEMYLGLSELRS